MTLVLTFSTHAFPAVCPSPHVLYIHKSPCRKLHRSTTNVGPRLGQMLLSEYLLYNLQDQEEEKSQQRKSDSQDSIKVQSQIEIVFN